MRRSRGERVPLAAITMFLVSALKKMKKVGAKDGEVSEPSLEQPLMSVE